MMFPEQPRGPGPGSTLKGQPAHLDDDPTNGYPDNGCEESLTCLTCPLPMCRWDDMDWYLQLRQARREVWLAGLAKDYGEEDIMRHYNVGKKTLRRAVARVRRGIDMPGLRIEAAA